MQDWRVEYGIETNRPTKEGSDHPDPQNMMWGGSVTQANATHFRIVHMDEWKPMDRVIPERSKTNHPAE